MSQVDVDSFNIRVAVKIKQKRLSNARHRKKKKERYFERAYSLSSLTSFISTKLESAKNCANSGNENF